MPHEIAFMGVYFTPWLVSAGAGLLLSIFVAYILNKTRLSSFFRLHQWSFLLFFTIFTLLVMRWSFS